MKLATGLFLFLSLLFTITTQAAPDWSEGVLILPGGRPNPYELNDQEFHAAQMQGRIHTQIYPVSVTGMLPPFAPINRFLNIDKVTKNLGLHEYPQSTDQGVYSVPYPNGKRPEYRMGFGLIESEHGTGFSFSCAACHSSNLFGKTVLGMTNRFPRANELFVKAKAGTEVLSPEVFKIITHATEGEKEMISILKENMKSIGVKKPIALGLDTSLAQVSLSLNHRNKDAYATKSPWFARFPREDTILDQWPADSKPAVWWNLKYKDRWLSDGSVISGNPIFTNILWNEIGRGADLRELETWLGNNEQKIKELTTAVFSSEAPRITDFFPAEKIDLARAQNGEQIFNKTCSRCHGVYEKAWSLPNSQQLSATEKIKTVNVRYKSKTPVVNVDTDPYRRYGMRSLEQLNDLAISKNNGIRIEAQNGYVPPPLVGIWARWPYLHNNAIPNLCALLTRSELRPKAYYSGEAQDPQKDFDFECNGYPLGNKTPPSWKSVEHYYDTRKVGMSNAGHDVGIFLDDDGNEKLTVDQKRDLILFLQTL
jgi:cytochrome c2